MSEIKRDSLGEYRDAPDAPIVGDDIDIAAYRAAGQGFGPHHSFNRLVNALEAARAEIERLRALVKQQEGKTS